MWLEILWLEREYCAALTGSGAASIYGTYERYAKSAQPVPLRSGQDRRQILWIKVPYDL